MSASITRLGARPRSSLFSQVKGWVPAYVGLGDIIDADMLALARDRDSWRILLAEIRLQNVRDDVLNCGVVVPGRSEQC